MAMRKQPYRVVVRLTDVDEEEQRTSASPRRTDSSQEYKLAPSPSANIVWQPIRSSSIANMEMFDPHALIIGSKTGFSRINKRNYREMHFDRVDKGTNVGMRSEMMEMINKLLIDHQNCCLIRLQSQRECPWPFLCNMLVTEMDKRFHQWHFTMESVRIEYHDVRKYDVVNMLEKNELSGSWRKHLKTHNQFANIQQLRKWLQVDYTSLFNLGLGHDFIDFHLLFYDTQRFMYSVKLSLVHLFLSRMDNETKSSLLTFFEPERPLKPSLLTSFLKDFFSDSEKWQTLLIYDVPTKNVMTCAVNEMLNLASVAYTNANIKRTSKERHEILRVSHLPSPPPVRRPSPVASIAQIKTLHPVSANSKKDAPKPTAENSNGNNSRASKMSNRMLTNLNYGYRRIDDKYAKVVEAMETYYSSKCDHKITKICSDISNMMRNIEGMQESVDSVKETDSSPKVSSYKRMQKYAQLYHQATSNFRALTKSIEASKYSALLKIYLNTKRYEIRQNELRLKVKQLETCRTRLAGTIETEVNALKRLNAVTSDIQKGQEAIIT